jgi:hypothetical protein
MQSRRLFSELFCEPDRVMRTTLPQRPNRLQQLAVFIPIEYRDRKHRPVRLRSFNQRPAAVKSPGHHMSCPGRRHLCPDMAGAHDAVKLSVAHFEEPFGFAIGVVLQTFGAQDRVVRRHSQGRAGATHCQGATSGSSSGQVAEMGWLPL